METDFFMVLSYKWPPWVADSIDHFKNTSRLNNGRMKTKLTAVQQKAIID